MQKIQIQAEVDIKSLLAQMDTDDLEDFVQKASAVLTQRKTTNIKAKETKLLQRLNEECILPDMHWTRLQELLQKRATQSLSEPEATQLENLIQEEESLRVKCVEILGKLAQLKGVTLEEVVEELDIQTVEID